MRDRRIWEVSAGPSTPLGHASATVTIAAVGLPNPPALSRRAVIRPLGQPINWRDDGVDPTAGTGMPLLADEPMVYDGEPLTNFKMIRAASATTDIDVRVAYYG